MTKRYRLKKDLPTLAAGKVCWIGSDSSLWTRVLTGNRIINPTACWEENIIVYHRKTLEKFPNILTDWFEEIPERQKTVWDLEEGDECWQRIITAYGTIASRISWHHSLEEVRSLGLITLTEEECLRKIAQDKAKVILERDTKGFKPSWRVSEYAYIVVFDHSIDDLGIYKTYARDYGTDILYFATEEDAEESIKKHEKEWLIYLGVEE